MRVRNISILSAIMIIFLMLSGCVLKQNINEHSSETNTPTLTVSNSPTVVDTRGSMPEATPQKIGISLPDKYKVPRWEQDGSSMKQQLEAAGYSVDLRYAGGDDHIEEHNVQITQLGELISADCDLLIVAAVDATSLAKVLVPAENNGTPVIAYERFIYDNGESVSYYVNIDGDKTGILFGRYIEEKLDLKNKSGPFNIELFGGDIRDSMGSAHFHWNGFNEFIQPYLDSGKLDVLSGQLEPGQVATEGYKTEKAQERMKSLIASQDYGPNGKKLDAVICLTDSIAQGVTQALLDAGYTVDNLPIITGMDCDIESVKNIISGTQSMSLYRNTLKLADRTVKMAESILNGEEPEVTDPNWMVYPNEHTVSAYFCDYDIVTRENYKELLIDSGYYTEEELQ